MIIKNMDQYSKSKVDYNPFDDSYIKASSTSDSQREIWPSLAMDPNATLCYNEAFNIELKGKIDTLAVEKSVNQLIKENDSLRSVFSGNGQFFFVKDYSYVKLDYIDFTKSSFEEFIKFKNLQVLEPFDLIKGPCFRFYLLKLDDGHYSLIFCAHHLICDGWSMAILIKDFSNYYNKLIKGDSLSPSEEKEQFIDYVKAIEKSVQTEKDRKYWLNKFAKKLNSNSLPTEFNRPEYRTFNSRRYDFAIPKEIVRDLRKIGAESGASLYTTLMAVWHIMLIKLTGSEDNVIGMASAGQGISGMTNMIGHAVNLLPLRVELNKRIPFNELLKVIKSDMFDAYEHQTYGYGNLVKELDNLERRKGELPLLSVVFNIDQQTPDQGVSIENVESKVEYIPRFFDNFELFINAVSCRDLLILECQYNTNLFSQSLIENWLANYLEVVKKVVQNPRVFIDEINLSYLKIPVAEVNETVKQDLLIDEKLEKEIALLWQEVLAIEDLEATEDFFAVGGHSLLAIELAEKLSKKYDQNLTIKNIFESPTIREQANLLLKNNSEETEKTKKVEQTNLEDFEASYAQNLSFYTHQFNKKISNLPAALKVSSEINLNALEKAMLFVINSQPSLRTVFRVENNKLNQIVCDLIETFSIPEIKTTSKDLISQLDQLANVEFDLHHGPLFKIVLLRLDNGDNVLFFTVHHAIWDGWSFDIFFDKLHAYYSDALADNEMSYDVPAFTYIDYTNWLNDQIRTGKLDYQIEYWKDKLKAPRSILELPIDYKRPLEISHLADTYSFQIEGKIFNQIKEFSQNNKTSIFNVLLTAYKITLAKYTGLEDILVGMPVRGRTKEEFFKTIGFFVNTVVLRSHIRLNESFKNNLDIVHLNTLDAYEHQLVPYQLIYNKLEKETDPTRSAIAQTFFTYQDVTNRECLLGNEEYQQVNVPNHNAHTDLDIWFKCSKEKMVGAIEFRNDLFKKETIERFFETYLFNLENLISNSDVPINLLRSLPERLENIIVKNWNNTWTNTGEIKPFHLMVNQIIAKYPNNKAITCGNKTLTYKELGRLTNRIAGHLQAKGIRPGDLVGISAHRDEFMVPLLLGILNAGAGYVPLDPSFPQDRLDYMVDSAKPKTLIVADDLVGRFHHDGRITKVSDILNSSSHSFSKVENQLSDTTYVIYTSGSTGNPKGVQLTHLSVSNFLISMQKLISPTPKDRLLAVTTLSFDIAVLELYLPLISGAEIYLASSKQAMDGLALKDILEKEKITILQATPSTWRLLLGNGWKGDSQLKVLCGGEAFPIDLAQKLIPMTKEVWNMYGPTETTVWSSCKRLQKNDDFITIGKPIDNTTMYILDNNRHMMPIGAIGELFIGGLGLAKGYYSREDLTSERFINDPFIPGMKMYATGDIARFKSNGEIECLGRNDGQVKIRGYRIELGEIEEKLQKVDKVKECTVVTQEYRPGDLRIVAFYSTASKEKVSDRVFREVLTKNLPQYMIPSHFVYMEEIPKTLNGKIDKKSLPKIQAKIELKEESLSNLKAFTQAENTDCDVKAHLRKLWANSIGVEKIEDEDNFFDLGGNSIIAVGLFSQINQDFGLNLNLATLVTSKNFVTFANDVSRQVNKQPLNFNGLEVKHIAGVFKSVVSLSNAGKLNPVFCFHGVGGNILNYLPLVEMAKGQRPFIAIQSASLDGMISPHKKLEEMAKFYINEMKLVQPEGPYLLAGGSMGGLIAFEVARQLEELGEHVERIIMFDTFGPRFKLKNYNENSLLKNNLVKKAKSLFSRIGYLFNTFEYHAFRLFGFNIPLRILLREVEMSNYKALWSYRPQSFIRSDIHLIRAKVVKNSWYSDPNLGWNGLTSGQIVTYEINGKHDSFIESPEFKSVLKKIL